MQKALGLHYRSQELLSSLSYQILFPGRLNCSLSGCQNCRALERIIVRFYGATSVFIFARILLQKCFLFDCDPILQNLINCINKQRMSSRIPLFLQLLQILLRPLQAIFMDATFQLFCKTAGQRPIRLHHQQVPRHRRQSYAGHGCQPDDRAGCGAVRLLLRRYPRPDRDPAHRQGQRRKGHPDHPQGI